MAMRVVVTMLVLLFKPGVRMPLAHRYALGGEGLRATVP